MPLNVPMLRSSFDLIVSLEPVWTPRFYDVLLSRYPEVRPLFANNCMARQSDMLQGALVHVLAHIEEPGWLRDTLGALGKKHVDYGVTREMYDYVGASLLYTLSEIAGDAWTPELEQVWKEAYGAIAGLMLEGSSPAPDSAA